MLWKYNQTLNLIVILCLRYRKKKRYLNTLVFQLITIIIGFAYVKRI